MGFAIEVAVKTNPSLMCEAVRKYLISAKLHEPHRNTERETDESRRVRQGQIQTHRHT